MVGATLYEEEGAMATVAIPPLVDALRAVPDPRKRRGQRHPLAAILALACAAMLCGADSLLAIAQWGRDQGAPMATRLGFTRERTPCVATFHRVFRRLDVAAFEQVVGQWAEQVCVALAVPGALHGVAIDGKKLRGSGTAAVPAVHLLSAFSQQVGVVLSQQAVGAQTNEIGALQPLLAALVLEGRVVTVDALLTQRRAAATILAKGGTI
jgi:hypothetical protein